MFTCFPNLILWWSQLWINNGRWLTDKNLYIMTIIQLSKVYPVIMKDKENTSVEGIIDEKIKVIIIIT